LSLARRLTDRDRDLTRAVARHRVLTSAQLKQMFFGSSDRARHRLVDLHRLGVLDRFEPMSVAFGRRHYHYVLGPEGAAILAAEDDEDVERAVRRCKRDRALALSQSQRLEHILGVNEFAASLIGHSRSCESAALVDWLTESEAARWTDGIVRPDAWGVWRETGLELEFFVEYDRGTETLARLEGKGRDYERFEIERGVTTWVLFAFTSPRREAKARARLVVATVPLATGVVAGPARPHDAIWLPVSGGTARVSLAELALEPKPPEATERAARSSARSWRFERSRPDDQQEEAPIEPP
jgi:hypothetical protein